MTHIYLNLKRFDVPEALGGVNRLADPKQWGTLIVEQTQDALKQYSREETEFVFYLPEAHIIPAAEALHADSPIQLGCQGVYREDVAPGQNFGAFTTNRPAAAVQALGCSSVLVGHCEERQDKLGIMAQAGAADTKAVNRLLNQEIRAAAARGLRVLYCIGEREEEMDRWQEVLSEQLEIGLSGVDPSGVVIAYEPVWSIGPGKTPADKKYITKVARFVKAQTGGIPVVYGGGLKRDNAAMLASIAEIDGGLIALTRFSGDFGFYPEEYLEIVHLYLKERGVTA